MNMKTLLVAGSVVAVGCAVAGVMILNRMAARQVAQLTVNAESPVGLGQAKNQASPAAERANAPAASEPASPELAVLETFLPEQDLAAVAVAAQPAGETRPSQESPEAGGLGGAQIPKPPAPSDAPVSEPQARTALKLVGFDAAAEQVWLQAINDSRLRPNDRKDLIEDLNRDGFPDHRNITKEDLPLIMRRIEIIERHAPTAMDEVNAAAFKEAHKDLMNMVVRLTRQ